MRTKKEFAALFVIFSVMCLWANALAIDDPNDLPELFDGSRQEASCSSFDAQETGGGGAELAE